MIETDERTPDDGEPGVGRRLFARGGFVANVFTLASGTTAALAVTVLAAPVLTRLYGPEEFAVLALFGAAVSVLGVGASGRYDFAIMLAKRDEEAANVAGLALVLSLLTTGAVLAAVLVFGDAVLAHLGVSGDGGWMWFLPAGVLIMAWTSISMRWQSRKKRFGTVALADASGAVCAASTQVGAGLLAESPRGAFLICGGLAGLFVRVAIMSWRLFADLFRFRRSVSADGMTRVAGRYWRFPALSVAMGMLGHLTGKLPVLLLAIYFDPMAVGLYALSARVLRMPMGVLGRAVGEVFFQRILVLHKDKARSRALYGAVVLRLLLLSVIPMAILFVWAEDLFAIAFGREWIQSGRYARLMIPLIIAEFTILPVFKLSQALEKQAVALVWLIVYLVLCVASFWLGRILGSPDVAILCYSGTSAGMYLTYFFLGRRLIAAGRTPAPPERDG